MEVERIVELDGHTYYKDADRKYSRIIGGIGWPGNKPGFLVVIGEDYYATDPQGKIRHLHLLVPYK